MKKECQGAESENMFPCASLSLSVCLFQSENFAPLLNPASEQLIDIRDSDVLSIRIRGTFLMSSKYSRRGNRLQRMCKFLAASSWQSFPPLFFECITTSSADAASATHCLIYFRASFSSSSCSLSLSLSLSLLACDPVAINIVLHTSCMLFAYDNI